MSQPAIKVWATGDGVRVNPVTGKYFEDRPRIHADYPSGDYRTKNAVWDGAKRQAVLRAARNEFVAFQVIVESRKPAEDVTVRFRELTGPRGVKISGKHVALFKAWYTYVPRKSSGYQKTSLGKGWYPDALMPVQTGRLLKFDLPDERNAIGPKQRNQSVWVDLFVPRDRRDAPPGTYEGVLEVTCGEQCEQIAVKLDVWDFALPDEIHCRGDIWNGSLRHMPAEIELAYYQMAHRHRFHPGVAGYRPEVSVKDTQVKIDWRTYDRRLKRYFDGSAFTKAKGYWGPGYGVPIPHIQLPFNCNKPHRTTGAWPISMPEGGPTADYEAVWLETARQFREHFDKNATWRKVRKIVFIGGLDESYNEAAYAKMIYFCRLLRRGLGKGWFLYRIDGGYDSAAMRKLHPYVDLWVCHTAGFSHEKIQRFIKKGVEPWFYGPMIYERETNSACGSNTFTDLDLLTGRGVGWAAFKCGSGYCEWEFDAFFDRVNDAYDPVLNWTEGINFRKGDREFAGSGLMIYRGDFLGKPGPIPSIRLKAHRRGFQDYEYLWLLREGGKGAQATRIVNSIIHTIPFGGESYGNIEIWKNNPEAWEQARTKAGEMLAAKPRTRKKRK